MPRIGIGAPFRVQKTVASVRLQVRLRRVETAQEKDSKNKIAFDELDGLSLDQVFSGPPPHRNRQLSPNRPLGLHGWHCRYLWGGGTSYRAVRQDDHDGSS